MKVTQRTITPKMAHVILSKNASNNRRLREHHVSKLARDMLNGKWRENGETIIISDSGELLDGQHRLSALIRSGTSQKMVVVKGVPSSAMATIDQGASRGLHDALAVAGHKSANALAATYRLVTSYLNRGYVSRRRYNKVRTATEAIEFIRDNPTIRDAVLIYRNKRNSTKGRSIIPDTIWAAMYFLIKQKHREKLEQFHHRVELGLDIRKGCPSYFLREIYLEKKAASMRGSSGVIMYDVIHYWNEFINDTKLRKPLSDGPEQLKLFGIK